MALIPILSHEGIVQVYDKTRLDATRSFYTTGETAISTLTIKPGLDGPTINIYNADSSRWYTDWAWTSQTFDIDSTNDKIYYSEGGTDYTATVLPSTYTVSTLCTAIKAALELASGGTFSVTIDSTNNKITIAKSNARFVLKGTEDYNALLPHIGFEELTSSSDSHTGMPVEYGIKKIALVANNGGTAVTYYFYQKVLSVSGDWLFSGDIDLISEESSILKYLPVGKSSFLFMHRRAQEKILEWLDQNGYVNVYEKKFTKFDFINIDEVRTWSKYLCLELIFRDFGNAKDDVFKSKADYYEKLAIAARSKVVLRIDVNEDGIVDPDTSPDPWSGSMVRS